MNAAHRIVGVDPRSDWIGIEVRVVMGEGEYSGRLLGYGAEWVAIEMYGTPTVFPWNRCTYFQPFHIDWEREVKK